MIVQSHLDYKHIQQILYGLMSKYIGRNKSMGEILDWMWAYYAITRQRCSWWTEVDFNHICNVEILKKRIKSSRHGQVNKQLWESSVLLLSWWKTMWSFLIFLGLFSGYRMKTLDLSSCAPKTLANHTISWPYRYP